MAVNPDGFYCIENVPEFEKITEELGFLKTKVVTSRDFDENAKRRLSAKNLAKLSITDSQFSDHMPYDGEVKKWAIPFVLCEGSAIFQVIAEPGTIVKPHAHDKGFIRLIAQGELTFLGLPQGEITLSAGDWIYIPPNQVYGYKVGIEPYKGSCCYCTRG